jgi:hypothetical protein
VFWNRVTLLQIRIRIQPENFDADLDQGFPHDIVSNRTLDRETLDGLVESA